VVVEGGFEGGQETGVASGAVDKLAEESGVSATIGDLVLGEGIVEVAVDGELSWIERSEDGFGELRCGICLRRV
jgi:hypothetical protein